MYFRTKSDVFARAVNASSRSIPQRSTMEILSYVLIDAADGKVSITGTNLELGVTITFPATIDRPGKAAVPAKALSEFVSTFPSGQHSISCMTGVDGAMSVQSDGLQRFNAKFKTADAGIYPIVATVAAERSIAIKASEFRTALDQTAFCAAKDDNRPTLSGVNIRTSLDDPPLRGLYFGASDGYRLGRRSIHANVSDMDIDIIVNARHLSEISRMISDKTGDVVIAVSERGNQMSVTFGDDEYRVLFITRLMDGTFPDLSRIIPTTFATKLKASKQDLLYAMKASAVFAKSAMNVVKMSIAAEENANDLPLESAVTFTAKGDSGSNEIRIGGSVEGGDVFVSFNTDLFSEIIGSMKTNDVVVCVNGATSPLLIRGDGDDFATHVLMPMSGHP